MAPPTPQSFGEAEKTHLKERLERTRKLKIAVKPGFPARVIKEQEAESTNSSSSGMNQKQGEIEGDKQSESKRSPDSPWLTDSEPPTRRSNPSLGASTTTCERENRGIRIEGFDIPASQPQPVPAACRPSLSRSTNASTSSLSLLFARTPFLAPAAPVEPACCPDVGTSASSGLAGQTWNGDIVGRTLAKSRAPTPSTPPDIARQATAPHVLSSSASLPSLTRATSCKRSRFLTTSTSLTTTPSTSPPKPSCTLQFTRRSTPARQHSFRDTWSAVQAGVKANDMVTRKKGVMAERPDSEIEQEEIDHSECEDLDFNCFREHQTTIISRLLPLSFSKLAILEIVRTLDFRFALFEFCHEPFVLVVGPACGRKQYFVFAEVNIWLSFGSV
ncbi:uncharacterized protein JCM15063_001144 [Sporobolomyces koalae]|uniref:uncharacterized protein n=1 Tax=Sporobolomyces koalae TaxID=500713 RepID=UPI00317248EA